MATPALLDRGHEDVGDIGAVGTLDGVTHTEVSVTTPIWLAVGVKHATHIDPVGRFTTRAKAHRGKPGVWISLHCNASDNPKANGLRLFHNEANDELHDICIAAMGHTPPELNHHGRMPDRVTVPGDTGYPRVASYISRFTQPVIVVEFGYMTNPDDLRYLTSAVGQAKLVRFTEELCDIVAGSYS